MAAITYVARGLATVPLLYKHRAEREQSLRALASTWTRESRRLAVQAPGRHPMHKRADAWLVALRHLHSSCRMGLPPIPSEVTAQVSPRSPALPRPCRALHHPVELRCGR